MQVEFKEGTNVIDNTYAYPISDEFAKINLDKLGYLDFTVRGGTPNNEYLYYELYLTEEDGNTLDSNYIKVYLTDDKNKEIVEPSIYNKLPFSTSNDKNGRILYSEGLTDIFEKKFRLYVWIDKDYTQNNEHQTFSFKVNLYAYNTEKTVLLSNTIKAKLNDSNSITDVDDEITYLSGTDDTINFNYVWYSGKLWRITSINPDGTMKMITQNTITSISWGANTTYQDSWIYQWLNEDFKDTLYNYKKFIVENTNWNATTISDTTKPPETTMVKGDIGLLTTYEYVQSYAKLGSATTESAYVNGYLNIGYLWWLITPSDNTYVRKVYWTGSAINDDDPYKPDVFSSGVRPVVCLKSDVIARGGEGTKENPYTLLGDKISATKNEKLNERVSGEYVKFDNKVYRIISIENGITKLNSIDYVRDAGGTIFTKRFSSGTAIYSEVDDSLDYWKGYLNNNTSNGWYGSISSNYKKMLVEGTYYLGNNPSNNSYKFSICKNTNSSITTRECERTTDTWTGYVGFQRVGEMFSSQLETGYQSSKNMWLITPSDNTHVRTIDLHNFIHSASDNQNTASKFYFTVRPSITLNSNVVITEGEGTEQSPYEIKCDNCS